RLVDERGTEDGNDRHGEPHPRQADVSYDPDEQSDRHEARVLRGRREASEGARDAADAERCVALVSNPGLVPRREAAEGLAQPVGGGQDSEERDETEDASVGHVVAERAADPKAAERHEREEEPGGTGREPALRRVGRAEWE